jgi:hypothetical protein
LIWSLFALKTGPRFFVGFVAEVPVVEVLGVWAAAAVNAIEERRSSDSDVESSFFIWSSFSEARSARRVN